MAETGPAGSLAAVDALVAGQQWTQALKALGPLRRSHPSDPAVWRAQALALRGAGELQEAQYAADRWASLDEDSTEPLRLRLELLSARKKHYAAVEVAEELTVRTPDDADAWYRLAEAQRAAGLATRARESIDRSLAVEPLRWQSHELAGLIEMAASRPGDAAPHFRDALRLDPDNGDLALSLQRALEAQDARQASARSTDSKRRKESRRRARDITGSDKERARQQAKAERQLRRSLPPTDASGRPVSRWRRARTYLAILVLIAMVGYLRFRSGR